MTAAEFKKLLQKLGVKMKVQQGNGSIIVSTPSYGYIPTRDEQRIVQTLAKQNGFTRIRQMPIDVQQYRECCGMQWEFFK